MTLFYVRIRIYFCLSRFLSCWKVYMRDTLSGSTCVADCWLARYIMVFIRELNLIFLSHSEMTIVDFLE